MIIKNSTQEKLRVLRKNLKIMMPSPIVRCVECGDHIVHNHVLIQRHYIEKHRAFSKLRNGQQKEGFKFHEDKMPKWF